MAKALLATVFGTLCGFCLQIAAGVSVDQAALLSLISFSVVGSIIVFAVPAAKK